MSLKRKDAPDEGGAGPAVATESSAVNWRKYLTETNLLISADATASRMVGTGSFAHALLAPELPLKGPQPFKTMPDVPDAIGRLRTLPDPLSLKACKCHKKKCPTCLSCVERHCSCKKSARTKRVKTASSDDEPTKEEEPSGASNAAKDEAAAAKPRKRASTKRLAPSSVRGCTCHRKKCETCRNCLTRHCKCGGRNADASDGGEDGDENEDDTALSGDDKEQARPPPPPSIAKKRKACACQRKKCELCQNCIARHCDCPPAESDGCSCVGNPKCPDCDHCLERHCLCAMEKLNNKLMNQVLFINAIADGKIKLGRRDRKDVVKDMKQRGFDLVDDELDFEYLLSLPLSALLKQDMDTLQDQADASQEDFVSASAVRAQARALETKPVDAPVVEDVKPDDAAVVEDVKPEAAEP